MDGSEKYYVKFNNSLQKTNTACIHSYDICLEVRECEKEFKISYISSNTAVDQDFLEF